MNNVASTLFNFRIPVSPALLFGLFGLLAIIWVVYTMVLRYHWEKYSVNKLDLLKMNTAYFIGSFAILALMGVSALMYLIPF